MLHNQVMAYEASNWFVAAKNDQVEIIKEMLQEGFDVNAKDDTQEATALIFAMHENAMEVFNVLIKHRKIDIDAEAVNGNDALMIACYKGNEKAVNALLKKNARVNKDGWSALHYAAANGNLNNVESLLEKDAFVNAVSPNGTTPIMMAARGGHIKVVQVLLKYGADPTLTNQQNYSAIRFANEHKNTKIAKELTEVINKELELEKKRNKLPLFPF